MILVPKSTNRSSKHTVPTGLHEKRPNSTPDLEIGHECKKATQLEFLR